MRGLAFALALVFAPVLAPLGCASAGRGEQMADAGFGGGGGDSGGGTVDGAPMVDGSMTTMPDAPPGPQTRTLTQTNNQMIKAGTSIACGSTAGTAANNYYRVFDLAAYGITSAFTVSKISFQIEHCDRLTTGTGCATVAVRVGTYSGTPGATLANASMAILASNANVLVPEVIANYTTTPPTTPGGTVDAPITATIPAGSKLLVEVDTPDGENKHALYMGSNDGGETGFGYIVAPDCSIATATNISGVAAEYPNVHLLMTVTGTY